MLIRGGPEQQHSEVGTGFLKKRTASLYRLSVPLGVRGEDSHCLRPFDEALQYAAHALCYLCLS